MKSGKILCSPYYLASCNVLGEYPQVKKGGWVDVGGEEVAGERYRTIHVLFLDFGQRLLIFELVFLYFQKNYFWSESCICKKFEYSLSTACSSLKTVLTGV